LLSAGLGASGAFYLMLSTSMALGTVQAAPAKASMSKSTATSEEEDEAIFLWGGPSRYTYTG